jgi:hypothetical protein
LKKGQPLFCYRTKGMDRSMKFVRHRTKNMRHRTKFVRRRTKNVRYRISGMERRTKNMRRCTKNMRRRTKKHAFENFEKGKCIKNMRRRTKFVRRSIKFVRRCTKNMGHRTKFVRSRTKNMRCSIQFVRFRNQPMRFGDCVFVCKQKYQSTFHTKNHRGTGTRWLLEGSVVGSCPRFQKMSILLFQVITGNVFPAVVVKGAVGAHGHEQSFTKGAV